MPGEDLRCHSLVVAVTKSAALNASAAHHLTLLRAAAVARG